MKKVTDIKKLVLATVIFVTVLFCITMVLGSIVWHQNKSIIHLNRTFIKHRIEMGGVAKTILMLGDVLTEHIINHNNKERPRINPPKIRRVNHGTTKSNNNFRRPETSQNKRNKNQTKKEIFPKSIKT